MRRLFSLLTLLLLVMLSGCSRRERTNPLDPANPATGGGPSGFNAIADFSLVRLSWDAQPDLDSLLPRHRSTLGIGAGA